MGAARLIWRNTGYFHYKICSFWPQMTPKMTFLHIRITRYPYPKSWVFCTGIGYRIIPEGGFLRVLGIRYLPVPEPKSSGIGYGCELGYTTLLATHVTLLVAGWGFRILGCPRQKPVQRALRSFYALILDPAYFCILFPLAIKYNTHYSLLLTLILGYFSLENRMLTLNSKLLILLLNCVRLNLYALEI